MNKLIIPQQKLTIGDILKSIFRIVTPVLLIILATLSAPIVYEHPVATFGILAFTFYISIFLFMLYFKIPFQQVAIENYVGKKVHEQVLIKLQATGNTIVVDGKHYSNVSKMAYKQLFWKLYPEIEEQVEEFVQKEAFSEELISAMKPTWERNILFTSYKVAAFLFAIYYIVAYCINGTVSFDFIFFGIAGAMASVIVTYWFLWNKQRNLRYKVLCDMSDAKVITKQQFGINEKDGNATTRLKTIYGNVVFQTSAGEWITEHITQKAGRFFNYYVFNNTQVDHEDLRLFAYVK